uniref:Protein kinase, AMP-activated, beta 1 non-catalytic subunit, a n=1 Tax=Neogobius melanostomus TaxID=47308 RepID=A0A8C6UXF5_9GOBI
EKAIQKYLSSSPPGPYHQDAYVPKVILNKDTGISCDPALLPDVRYEKETLSLCLTGWVMVLSATHRYKKKYVTTLLYKPI